MNPNKEIKIDKVTLNIGTGKDQKQLEKALILLETISGRKPVKCTTEKRIQQWGLRKGLPIGAKVTLRGNEAADVLKRLLETKDNKIKETSFDQAGNVSFGVHEYIDIPGMNYIPEVGVMGLEIAITLMRNGYRVSRRKRNISKVSKSHKIKKEESIEFLRANFNAIIGDEQ